MFVCPKNHLEVVFEAAYLASGSLRFEKCRTLVLKSVGIVDY